MTINALYNVVDSMFVAMVSQKALTSVSLVLPIQLLMISLAIGSGVGVNSLISRRLGAKRFDEADKAAGTSIRIGLFNFIIFACVGIFLAKPFMQLYTDDQEIFDGGVTYLKIITIFCFFQHGRGTVGESTTGHWQYDRADDYQPQRCSDKFDT